MKATAVPTVPSHAEVSIAVQKVRHPLLPSATSGTTGSGGTGGGVAAVGRSGLLPPLRAVTRCKGALLKRVRRRRRVGTAPEREARLPSTNAAGTVAAVCIVMVSMHVSEQQA